ncbi:ATP-dependent DNA helicase [Fusarium oxysporum f. sp. albedinis]|nr:ATP-dependent DNA helicase [Fusarium oxysporum f. sp. albedinis]
MDFIPLEEITRALEDPVPACVAPAKAQTSVAGRMSRGPHAQMMLTIAKFEMAISIKPFLPRWPNHCAPKEVGGEKL